jgi:hypothetical protein
MTLKDWWEELTCTEWSENRLLSRKWLLVVGVVLWALISDAAGHPLSDTTANIIEWCVPPWVAIQGFVDMYRYRVGAQKVVRHRKKKEEGNDE